MAYKLTALGESRVLRSGEPNDPESAILSYLYEQKDAVEVEEIAGETRLGDDQTQRVLNRLVNGRYIKEV